MKYGEGYFVTRIGLLKITMWYHSHSSYAINAAVFMTSNLG